MNQQKRIAILTCLRDSKPEPKTTLIFSSTFELLISVLLSAQATDIGVNKVTAKLYPIANTTEKILALGFDKVRTYIKTIGLFNNKAKNIIKICQILINRYNNEVPKDRKNLESLPGVGRKTANVILNAAFGKPTIAVDTHVLRVCNRTNFASGKNVAEVEKKLLKVVPIEFKVNCHNWLMLHGRNICIARKPRCKYCIINGLCEFKNKIL